MNPVAILCGGLATRLRPVTETIPKSLVEVAGRPFIEWQLDDLQAQGVSRVVLCVGYLGELIEHRLGNGERFGLRIEYVFDGPKLLGTAGALKRAESLLGDAFFVLYGDSFLRLDYSAVAEVFGRQGKLALMTVFRNEGKWDRSNVIYRDGQIVRYDKKTADPEMAHIDYGLGMLKTEALRRVPDQEPYDLAALYAELVEEKQLAGFEVHERFYEIGTPAGLEETRGYFRDRRQTMASYSEVHLDEAADIISRIDTTAVESIVELLRDLQERSGRLFFLGVGGGAGNASHAVNDFRKIAGIESYAPTDNVPELTARINDDGWEGVFVEWLKVSRFGKDDMIFVLSVGGGSLEPMISPNLVRAIQYAKEVGARVVGIVGRDGGYTGKAGDAVVVIPTVNAKTVTPHTESFQAVIWHLIVSHPSLQKQNTKWESVR